MVSRRERRRGEEVIVIFLPTEWVSELLTLPEHSSLAAPLSPVLRVLAYSSRATWDCLQLAGWHYGLSDAWDLISVPTGSTSSFMTAQAALYSKKRQSILVFELLHASKPRPFFFFFLIRNCNACWRLIVGVFQVLQGVGLWLCGVTHFALCTIKATK